VEVENDGCGNNGHPNFAGRKSDAARFQIFHDACCGVQTESAPSTQENRVHALHKMAG
jgi:hypothetical protein